MSEGKLIMGEATQRFALARRVLRVLVRTTLWGVLALFLLFLTALAINAFDERPSPEALALLRPPESRYKPEENIYVALAGFTAPAGQSVTAAGQSSIARYDELNDAKRLDPTAAMNMLLEADKAGLQFEGKLDCCHPKDRSFWEQVRANATQIKQLVGQNRELYERYLALFRLPGYYETAHPTYLAPIYLPPTPLRSLFVASVAAQLQSGDEAQTQAALTILRQDTELWHRVLAGEGTVIVKIVAIAYLQADFLVLADMIADSKTTIPSNMTDVVSELGLSQWSIDRSFASEFRVHTVMFRQINDWQRPDIADSAFCRWCRRTMNSINRVFFKFNATENLYARFVDELERFSELSPPTFSTKKKRLEDWARSNANPISIRMIYNPLGRTLVGMSQPIYEDYVLRACDASAVQRLVRLSFEIRRQQITPDTVDAFIKLHPEWSTHPADGRAFLWNPTAGEIAVQTVAQKDANSRSSIPIWRTTGS